MAAATKERCSFNETSRHFCDVLSSGFLPTQLPSWPGFICLTAAKLLFTDYNRLHHDHRPCGDAATLNVAQQPCHYGHRHLVSDPPSHAASGYTTDYDDFDEDDDERGMAVDFIGHDGGKGSGQIVEKRLLSFAVWCLVRDCL